MSKKNTKKAPVASVKKAPRAGGTCARVWELADKLRTRYLVLEAALKEGLTKSTVTTQYQAWRKANNITERSQRAPGRDKSQDRKPTPKPGIKAPPPPKSRKAPAAPKKPKNVKAPPPPAAPETPAPAAAPELG